MSDVPRPAILELMVGSWRVAMSTTDATGQVTQSDSIRATKSLFADGRYLREELAGPFADERHEKLTLLGLNSTRQRWEYMTADNHDGVILLYAGAPGDTDDPRRIELIAEYAAPAEDPAHPAEFVVVRTLIEVEGRDRHRLRNFYRPGGKPERPFLEYVYEREGNEPS